MSTSAKTYPKLLLIAESQPQPYSAPTYEYASVVKTTAKKIVYFRDGEQKYILKRKATVIDNQAQQQKWEGMYQKYQNLMEKYARAINTLERYDRALEKYQGCSKKQIPNPLSEYVVQSQSQSDCAVYSWHIPEALLLKAAKHTTVMVRTLTEQGRSWGLQPQSKIFLLKREQWESIEQTRNVVQAQYSQIKDWLKDRTWGEQIEPSLPLPLFSK